MIAGEYEPGLVAWAGGASGGPEIDLGRGRFAVPARDLLPAGLQDPTEQVADERPSGVADRQRPGGIRGYELDVDRPGAGRRKPAPRFRLADDGVERRLESRVGQAEVDEAGSDGIRFGNGGLVRARGGFSQ